MQIDRPILVHGPRKGGTTLVQGLLDTTELAMLPGELKLKRAALHAGRSAEGFTQDYLTQGRSTFKTLWEVGDGLELCDEPTVLGLDAESTAQQLDVDSLAERLNSKSGLDVATVAGDALVHIDAEAYAAAMSRLLEAPVSTYRAALEHDVTAFVAARRGEVRPQRWGAKEVGTPVESVVATFFEAFPDGYLVHVARDPRMVVRSIIRDRRRRGISLPVRQILLECMQARHMQKFSRLLRDAERVLVVAYEDLVADVEAETHRIADFVGLPWSESWTRPSVCGRESVVVTASQATRGVFQDDATWKDGLSLREIAIVGGAFQALELAG